MNNIDRIRLTDVLDEHFCMLVFNPLPGDRAPEDRVYRNKNFRTLDLAAGFTKNGAKRIQNLLEIKNNRVLHDLRFRFTDEHVRRVAGSRAEEHLNKISFGWADIFNGAPYLVIDTTKAGMTPYRVVRWLDTHIERPALTLEGPRYVRASFSHENDFMLAKLKFC